MWRRESWTQCESPGSYWLAVGHLFIWALCSRWPNSHLVEVLQKPLRSGVRGWLSGALGEGGWGGSRIGRWEGVYFRETACGSPRPSNPAPCSWLF